MITTITRRDTTQIFKHSSISLKKSGVISFYETFPQLLHACNVTYEVVNSTADQNHSKSLKSIFMILFVTVTLKLQGSQSKYKVLTSLRDSERHLKL